MPPESVPTLRVITANVFAHHANWPDRLHVLRDAFRELSPDIVCLQETMLSAEHDQARDILGPDYHLIHSDARSNAGDGVSIASRWPITGSEELELKTVSNRTGAFACTTLVATTEAPAPFGTIAVANHFPDYQVDHEYERERQAAIAAGALRRYAETNEHVLLMGDLDAEIDSASLRFLAGKRSHAGTSVCYVNCFDATHPGEQGHTFTPDNPLCPHHWPFRRIDHIFIRCGRNGQPTLRIVDCRVVLNEPVDGVWPSDHFGVMADFRPLTADEAW
ncbi:MAG TPA: endonuclease/exonuclease/phosphatase family protein [Thermomicrobiales bacterium]|nr:endonuclease/exonuclease/phosphatase family protein [Thermomicrobiales bacterium]